MNTTVAEMWFQQTGRVSKVQIQQVLNEADAVPNPLVGLEAFTEMTFDVPTLYDAANTEIKVSTKAKIEYFRTPLPKRLHKVCVVS